MARYYLDFTFCSLSNRWLILKNECETTVNAVRELFVLLPLRKYEPPTSSIAQMFPLFLLLF